MRTKNNIELNGDNESIQKPLIAQRLITLIKSKYDEIDGIEYDCMVKDYQLLKSSDGFFTIEISTK
ncbi:hypothetical protein I2486_17135 [Cellulophaga sp. E16_2]|uniref:hypothetical protein n=1 Tax=Cellulophaga sp. E16_2 TaxID=2789297 RepID=UPI001A92DDA1|nr:hypothetical protein [Cellulophaga sp. E16_2]MBO0593129.1 hypothetical protein [Cellulophaga sp. E16_2]